MRNTPTVLIADDSRMDRMLCRHGLKKDYRLIEVCNGAEALEYLNAHPGTVDLLVSDLLMPEMSGIQLLEAMHSSTLQEIPTIIATSTQDPEAEQQCLSLGCWDFLRKPYDPVILEMRIRNTLERKALYQMREQHIVSTFERYVDPTVVDVLLKDPDLSNSAGRTADITVLFADIRGFTTLSEMMGPEEVLRLVNECSTITAQCVKEFGGVLDKFIGDCTMAYWGAPMPCEDGAYLACRAAMEMLRRTEGLFARYSALYHMDVALGIGIHQGAAIAGNVGAPDRMNYTVVGDTVNTASRLESSAPLRKIYISRTVAEALGNRGHCTSLGSKVSLKGKHRETEVLTLDGLD